MIVCLCTATDDRAIREAIESGESTVEGVMQSSGAGTGCGGCHEFIEQMIADERRPEKRLPMLSPYLSNCNVPT